MLVLQMVLPSERLGQQWGVTTVCPWATPTDAPTALRSALRLAWRWVPRLEPQKVSS
jgi:hypothetical protein